VLIRVFYKMYIIQLS